MDKPISVLLNDARNILVDAVNQCNLHPALLEPIFREIYSEVKYHAEIISRKEQQEYEHALTEAANSEPTNR